MSQDLSDPTPTGQARFLDPDVREYIAERGGMLRVTREAILVG